MSEYSANISKLRLDNFERFEGRDLTDRQVVEELYELGKKTFWKGKKDSEIPSLAQFAERNGVKRALRTKRSFTESLPGFAQLFGQGASSGFGDELAGYYAPTIQTALAAGDFVSDAASGVELKEAYENAKADLEGVRKDVTDVARREIAETREDHPVTAFGSELAGGIAQSALGGVALRGLGTTTHPAIASMGAQLGRARQVPSAVAGANVGRMAGQLGIGTANAGTQLGQVAARAPSTMQAVSQYLGKNALLPQSIRGAAQGATYGAGATDGSGDMASNMLVGAGVGAATPFAFRGAVEVAKRSPAAFLLRSAPRLAAAIASKTGMGFHRNFAFLSTLQEVAKKHLGDEADAAAVRAFANKLKGVADGGFSAAERRAKYNELGISDELRDIVERNASVIDMEFPASMVRQAPKAPARPSAPPATPRGAPARPSAPPATPLVQSRKPPPHTGPVKQDPVYVALLGPLSKVGAGQRIGISKLQRRFRIGYDRAERILKQLELDGLVSAAQGPKGVRTTLSKPQSPLSRTFGQAPVSQLSRTFGTPSAAKAVPDAVVQPAARAAARSAPPSIANSPLVQRFGADPASNLSRRFGADSLTPPAQLQRAGLPSAMGAPRSALGADVSASYAQGMLPRLLQNRRTLKQIDKGLIAVRDELQTPEALARPNVADSLMRTQSRLLSEAGDATRVLKNRIERTVGDPRIAQRIADEGRFDYNSKLDRIVDVKGKMVGKQKLRDLGRKYAAEEAEKSQAIKREAAAAAKTARMLGADDMLDGGVLSQDSLLSRVTQKGPARKALLDTRTKPLVEAEADYAAAQENVRRATKAVNETQREQDVLRKTHAAENLEAQEQLERLVDTGLEEAKKIASKAAKPVAIQGKRSVDRALREETARDKAAASAIKKLRKDGILPTVSKIRSEARDKLKMSEAEIKETAAYKEMRAELDPVFKEVAENIRNKSKIKRSKLRGLIKGLGVARDDAAILISSKFGKDEPDAPAPAPAKARAAASTQGRPATPAMRKFIKNGFDKLFNPQTGDKPGKFGAGVVATALNKQSADKNDLVSLNYQQLPTFSSPQAQRLLSKLKVVSRADRQAVLDADMDYFLFSGVKHLLPDLHKNAFRGNFTERMRDAIERAERETGVPASLLLGLLRKESAYGRRAISDYEKNKGVPAGRGAFQFIATTALKQAAANPVDRDRMAKALLGPNASRLSNSQKTLLLRYTPEWGALHAARLIKSNADVLETDNAALVAAAYNAGANNIKSKIRRGK